MSRRVYCLLVFLVSVCFLLLYFFVLSEKQVQEARIIFTQGCESDWDANQMRELLYQDRSAHRHLDLRQQRVPRCPFIRLTLYCSFFGTALRFWCQLMVTTYR